MKLQLEGLSVGRMFKSGIHQTLMGCFVVATVHLWGSERFVVVRHENVSLSAKILLQFSQ